MIRVTVISISIACNGKTEIRVYASLVSTTGTICGLRHDMFEHMEKLHEWFGSLLLVDQCIQDVVTIERPYFFVNETLNATLESFVKRELPYVKIFNFDEHRQFFEDVIAYTQIT